MKRSLGLVYFNDHVSDRDEQRKKEMGENHAGYRRTSSLMISLVAKFSSSKMTTRLIIKIEKKGV
jgi:hypothetical protein